jgi:hypothetical protein
MTSDHIIFAGVDLSSGSKPVTCALLDEDLNVLALHKWTLSQAISCLLEFENVSLAVNPSTSADVSGFTSQAGFKQSAKQNSRPWAEIDSQQAFMALCEDTLLPRRTIEGRIQRALLLYEEGLQIPDPMDFFEEITRHKLIQGILPLESMYTIRELDALVAAYAAWMLTHRPRQVSLVKNKIVLSTDADR